MTPSPGPTRRIPQLSKSRFLAGLQCPKRLYLECFHREGMDDVGPRQQAIFDQGSAVGEVARGLRPGGVLVEEDHFHHREAVERTREAMADPDIPAIYEAAFVHDDVKIRVDILARRPRGGWEAIEVKSSTRVKDVHVPDVGIQLFVLEGAGVDVRRVYLAFLDRTYMYPGGTYDPRALFALEDLTGDARARGEAFAGRLAEFRRMLAAGTMPEIEVGPHCDTPYPCSCWGYCHGPEERFGLDELYRPGRLLDRLAEDGIERIHDIPEGYEGLSEINERIRWCVATGKTYFDTEGARILAGLGRPLHFLDFETIGPGLPRYVGTHPYDTVAFQFSNHTLHPDGRLAHAEYLHEGPDDPRPAVARALLDPLGTEGGILMYTPYERQVIENLAGAVPDLAGPLRALLPRLFDLHPVVRKHAYHPDFRGSFSLKYVLPAILGRNPYEGMAVDDGQLAGIVFEAILDGKRTGADAARARRDLLAYCRQDTQGMVDLYRWFVKR